MALGVEASGTVREVGRGVSRFRAGDPVLTHSVPLQQGTSAELFVSPQAHVAHKPLTMAWLEAALFPGHRVQRASRSLEAGKTGAHQSLTR
jgi:NADPH:quinone reductase-like Zn-dependent oxidoreductase